MNQMKFAVFHFYQDIDGTDKEYIHSVHNSYEDANEEAESHNKCISSYEFYYVDVI